MGSPGIESTTVEGSPIIMRSASAENRYQPYTQTNRKSGAPSDLRIIVIYA
jgi:hypothetical protein